jgi:hypothetical protein
VRCSRFWGADEHMARRCCSDDFPCKTEGCEQRTTRGITHCCGCRSLRMSERWAKLPMVAWDGETPLSEWDNDRFFFSEDELLEYLWERAHDDKGNPYPDPPEPPELVICKQRKRSFSMADHLSDDLAEDDETNFDEIDKVVNDWIEKNVSLNWWPSNVAVNPESLPKLEPSPE